MTFAYILIIYLDSSRCIFKDEPKKHAKYCIWNLANEEKVSNGAIEIQYGLLKVGKKTLLYNFFNNDSLGWCPWNWERTRLSFQQTQNQDLVLVKIRDIFF